MKQVGLLGFLLLCSSCGSTGTESPKMPLRVINYDPLLRKTDDGWFYKGQVFSGFMIEIEKNKQVVYELPIQDGKENGLARGWYNTGEKLLERPFVAGKKEGVFKQWWPNGHYRYVFHYTADQYDGQQLVFYPNGRKRQESTYVGGQEEGRQRAWDETGDLVSNYSVRNKKIYGIVAVKSCLPVDH